MSQDPLLPPPGGPVPPGPPIVLQKRQTGGKDIPPDFYAQEVAKLVQWLENKDNKDVKTVKKFGGFTENAYRYVFAYEAQFPDEVPHLKTILPSGRIENTKDLSPEEKRGIIAYTYSQKMLDKMQAEMFITQKSPFVWEKAGEPYVMQTWPTKFNDQFKKDFELFKYPNNPDPVHFEQEALEDFKRVALALFKRPHDEDPPLWLGHKKTENKLPMYQGTGNQLMALLRLRKDIRDELCIKKILEPDGFVSKFTAGEDKGEKPFHMDLSGQYALYQKKGWETMACVKPLDQFDWEANRYDEMDISASTSDDGVISFPCDMEWVSGPAYFWAWSATVVIWGGAIITVTFAYFFYQRADWWENGLLSNVGQHLANTCTAAMITGAIMFGVWADNKAMSYCIVPWLQNVEKSCMVPFFGQRSCKEFRCFSLLCTVSQMMTIQLNAWVLANTIRNSGCRTEKAWQWLWEQGGVGYCPISVKKCLALFWCLSALQLIVPTFFTLAHNATNRKKEFSVPEEVGVNRNNDKHSYKFNCKSLLSGCLTEGVTLMALAAGMRYTGAVSLTYPLASIKRIKDQQIGFLTKKEGDAGESWEPTSHGWQFRCVKELQKLYSIQVKRLWFNLVFKYSFQMNIQVSLFIIRAASLGTKEFNYAAALGELLSLGAMMLGIASELFDLKTLLFTFWDVRAVVNDCFKLEMTQTGNWKDTKEKDKEAQQEGGEPKKDGDEEEGCDAKLRQWVTALPAPHIPWLCHCKNFMQNTFARHFLDGHYEELTYGDLNKEYWRVLGVTIFVVLVLMFAMWLIVYEILKFGNFFRCPGHVWSFSKGCLNKGHLDALLKTCSAQNSG